MGTLNGEAKVTLAGNGETGDSLVFGCTEQGIEIRASLLKLTRYSTVFEIYTPGMALRTSEVFSDFRIVLRNRTIYSGRAVVRNLVDAKMVVICEATLSENCWMDLEFTSEFASNGKIQAEFAGFLQEWQKLYKVSPEFKVVTADMQSFLYDLRVWIEQIELNVRSQPSGGREGFEREVLEKLREPVLETLGSLFERFEQAAQKIEDDLKPAHSLYVKRQLHPVVLCSPFMYRTFQKPLGYAGDYEMVNMMVRDAFQGSSTFAKVLNAFFLNTPPVIAHRNRIDSLTQLLTREINRVVSQGKIARVLNLGCGPALEVQAFLAQSPLSSQAQFTLLDFNSETVRHTEQVLIHRRQEYNRSTQIQVINKSVHQLLKEHAKPIAKSGLGRFELVYCAGLFDYLSNHVCEKLLSIFYEMVAPGGCVVVTNVDSHNPSQGWMDYVVDWHLVYRGIREITAILPKAIPRDAIHITTEATGVNTFIEIRKPENA